MSTLSSDWGLALDSSATDRSFDETDVILVSHTYVDENALQALITEAMQRQDARALTHWAQALDERGPESYFFHPLFAMTADAESSAGETIDQFIVSQAIALCLAGVPTVRAGLTFDTMRSARFSELLSVRRSHAAFHPCAPQHTLTYEPQVFAVERTSEQGDEKVLCLHNVSSEPVKVWTGEHTYIDLIRGAERGAEILLRPYEVAWLHQYVIDLT